VTVRRAGLFTTVQDGGRPGYRRYGVPVSGAMDRDAMAVANRLIGNLPDAPVLECTLQGPVLHFEEEALIAVAGDVEGAADGEPLPTWRPVRIAPGTTVSLERIRSGCRAILAIAGGWQVPRVLGSASTYVRAGFGGVDGRALRPGDVLTPGDPPPQARIWLEVLHRAAPQLKASAPAWSAGWSVRTFPPRVLRVVPGPEWPLFTDAARQTFTTARFRVTPHADRMGLRLEGPPLATERAVSMRSEPVTPGTVQVPPDGKPIVLAADSQTTGGYPRIGVVIQADLSKLAQLRPHDTVSFVLVTKTEARAALEAQHRARRVFESALALRARTLQAGS
jgi:antagonist of KipI